MKIVEINSGNFGSTGTIMLLIKDEAILRGHEVTLCYPSTRTSIKKFVDDVLFIGNRYSRNLGLRMAALLGTAKFSHTYTTLKLIKQLKKINPDIVHIHNLHPSYLNIPLFFKYLNRSSAKTVWTLHDCWPFTGHCPHFEYIGCAKWKVLCKECPLHKEYPASWIDDSTRMHLLKKDSTVSFHKLTIVTPSVWLARYVKQSFLGNKRIEIINNGIDLSVFKPTSSNFKDINGLSNKKIVLGVSFGWNNKKGLDVFIELSRKLPDSYKIVLVGTTSDIIPMLPSSIFAIERTSNQKELAEIYSAAFVFVNPTREENFPTVNMESLSCGTPVITFKTGGSSEIIDDKTGVVVGENSTEAIFQAIISTPENKYNRQDCVKRARELYSTKLMTQRYFELFEQLINEK